MEFRVREVVDWAVSHGILMQAKDRDGFYEHAPMSLEATPFPVQQFTRAVELAAPFNSLVDAVAAQPQWLLGTLASVEAEDAFTARLMALLREVVERGETQKLRLGLHRSDYMLHRPDPSGPVGILQVTPPIPEFESERSAHLIFISPPLLLMFK